MRMNCFVASVSVMMFAFMSIVVGVPHAAAQQVKLTAFADDLGPTFTNNAYYSSSDRKPDLSFSPSYGLKVGAAVGNWGLAGALKANNDRFIHHPELGLDTLSAKGGFNYKAEGLLFSDSWTFSAAYSPKWAWNTDFAEFQYAVHDFNFVAGGGYKIGEIVLSPELSIRKRLSTVDAIENTKMGLSFEIEFPAVFGWKVSMAPGVFHTVYNQSPSRDHLRHDTSGSMEFAMKRKLADGITASIGATAIRNISSITGRDYNVLSGGPVLGLAADF